jgi:hypothetical protein
VPLLRSGRYPPENTAMKRWNTEAPIVVLIIPSFQ